MIRLIVSDIDGTLVPEGVSYINPEYLDVIRELTDMGVQFAVASGRQVSSIDAVFHEIGNRIYYLSDNGAYIQRDEKALKEVCMAREDVKELLLDLQRIPEHHVLLSAKEGYYTDDKSSDFHNLVFEQYKGVGSVVDKLEAYADACIKVSLYYEKGAMMLYDLLDKRWKDRLQIYISGARWIDINAQGVSKGNAVHWIQKQYGITPEETVVFGDNFNDISMMERSKRSYASVLSHPDIKKAADYEVASYEVDGVLQVLKQIAEEIRNEK